MNAGISLDVGILIVAALYILYAAVYGPKDYQRLKSYTDTGKRQGYYRKTLIEGIVAGLIGGLVILLLKGRLDALTVFPPEFVPAQDFLRGPVGGTIYWLLFAAIFGLWVIPRLIRVMKLPEDEKSAKRARATFQAIPFFPRNRPERTWAIFISLNAGINEELLFRLALPVVVFSATGNLLVALFVPLVAFGLGHVFQGMAGVINSMFMGAMLLGLYLATGSIWVAMAMHAFVDLLSIVFLPWVLDKRERLFPEKKSAPGKKKKST